MKLKKKREKQTTSINYRLGQQRTVGSACRALVTELEKVMPQPRAFNFCQMNQITGKKKKSTECTRMMTPHLLLLSIFFCINHTLFATASFLFSLLYSDIHFLFQETPRKPKWKGKIFDCKPPNRLQCFENNYIRTGAGCPQSSRLTANFPNSSLQ